MRLRQSGTSLIGWEADTPIAQVVWNVVPAGWYINFLAVEQPRWLAPLLSRFRQIWRANGRPRLLFNASPDNAAMLRLTAILGAEQTAGAYHIADLDLRKAQKLELNQGE